MSIPNSTARSKRVKPKKPHKDFPLFPHASGQWAKKIRGKTHYFGTWADHEAALNLWLAQKDELLAGRVPRCTAGVVESEGPELRDLVNKFLTTKAMLRENGELSPYTLQAYHAVCGELVETFGRNRLLTDISPEDFQTLRARWSKKWGVERLSAEITRARVVFNFAYKNGLIDRPMLYGEGFAKPSVKAIDRNKEIQGIKMFEAEELRNMIAEARQPMKSMLLLAANCAFGNNDVAMLPMSAVDLDGGWVTFPRPKTAVKRRAALWPETIHAVQEWLARRPKPKSDDVAELVFLTARGDGWGTDIKDRPITHECRKILDRLGIKGNRNFYCIRHGFETVAGECLDLVAVDCYMGHRAPGVKRRYREKLPSDERLYAVADHVREWLFGVRIGPANISVRAES